MDTKALRQKILDLAIRGKLVPQDPNDEPASVLLERIRAEKQQMVKEGKLKAKDIKNDTVIFVGEDNLHYEKFPDGSVKCIEEEIPFAIPQGWEWCRLGDISVSIQYGLSNSAEPQGSHRLLRITDIQEGMVNWDKVPFTTIEDAEPYKLKKNDILFARTGATVGKSFLINDLPYESVYASYLIRIRLMPNLSPDYLYYFFNSPCYWQQITDKSVGVGQPNCNGTSLKELLIPLPSLKEQLKVVSAANLRLGYVSIIEYEKNSLQRFINTSKSKILDLAIRGKLVPQDPNDEPASVLLERIRAEKEDLIKQGKIKRDKKESVIFRGEDNSYYEKIGQETRCIDDELPFEIPQGWEVVSFSETNYFISETVDPGKYPDEMFELYSVPNFDFKRPEIVSGKLIGSTKQAIVENDILVCKINPRINRVWITENITNFTKLGSSEWIVFRNNILNPQYLCLFFSSPFFREKITSNVSGVGGSLTRAQSDLVKKYPILIPPLREQMRIVNVALSMLNSLHEIEKSLN